MESAPDIVFIVPYRNRPQHKFFFTTYLRTIMNDSPFKDKYEVYFAHQCDARSFNRGATKNIGFIAVKNKYPNDYKRITFVFNDIDTMPFSSIFNYQTSAGTVKHFYGFTYALGGIVALTGEDFENINGFPNFWGWGMEDNVLQTRCESHKLHIDRSHFYAIGNPHILHLFDGIHRIINKKDPWRATHDDGVDGLSTIRHLKYTIDNGNNSANMLDNVYVPADIDRFFMTNISTFTCNTPFEIDVYCKYDLREPPRRIINPNQLPSTTVVQPPIEDWSHIPFYPTSKSEKQAEDMYQVSQQPQRPQKQQKQQIQQPPQHQPLQLQVQPPPKKRKASASVNIRLGGVY